MWKFFCSLNVPAESSLLSAVSYQKLIVFSIFFEIFGLGCASGPLTGRNSPFFTAFRYFLRSGTIKRPLFSFLGSNRTIIDVLLYILTLFFCILALIQNRPSLLHFQLIGVSLLALSIMDTTAFLCARGEHYCVMLLTFIISSNNSTEWIVATRLVQLALWVWAGNICLQRIYRIRCLLKEWPSSALILGM